VFSAFSVAISFVPPWLCGWQSIMQNKAKVKMGNINISTARTKAYANKQRTMNNERYPKQTQSNPISPPHTSVRQTSQLHLRTESIILLQSDRRNLYEKRASNNQLQAVRRR
jgi:hypothetical protein